MAKPDTPDPNLENQEPEEPQRPEWLPDKFPDIPAFVKSYGEAERKITELATANKTLDQNYQDLLETRTAEQQQALQPQGQWDEWEILFANDPARATALLVQQSNQQLLEQMTQQLQQTLQPYEDGQGTLIAEQALTHLRGQYDDFASYEPRIQETLVQNEHLLPPTLNSSQQVANILESVYEMVKARDVLSGKVQPVDQTAAKANAQTLTGTGDRQPQPAADAAEWERIRKAGQENYWSGPTT